MSNGGSISPDCKMCGAWFLYDKDANGVPVPGGVYVLGIRIPCAGIDPVLFTLMNQQPLGPYQDQQGNYYAFSEALNGGASGFIASRITTDLGDGWTKLIIQEFAAAVADSLGTVLTAAQGAARDYYVACADGTTDQPNVCPPGFTYDPATESCRSTIVVIPPVCPPGYTWDQTTETCKPDNTTVPPPPICPPGYTWNPQTQTCDPNPVTKGQPSCPPWQVLPQCFPLPPTPDDSLDEIGDLSQLSAWGDEVIAIAILNVYQALLGLNPGGSASTDPVTCTQLSTLMRGLINGIAAGANSIAAAFKTGGTAPVVNVTVEPAPVTVTVDQTDLTILFNAAAWDANTRQQTIDNAAAVKAQVAADAATLAQGLQ